LLPGNLYVALKGTNLDGHAFVAEAFARGAAGAMVSAGSGHEGSAEKPLLRVDDPIRALGEIASAYRLDLGCHVVGVTGSAGKSTVKEMAAQMLATSVPTAATVGNWNNDIGLPLSMLGMDRGVRAAVFEVGTNHPGEIAALCRLLRPDWAVVTNVGPVHLEFFGSVAAIAGEKAELLRCLPADGTAVVNMDGGCCEILLAACSARVVTVSGTVDADYRYEIRDPVRNEFLVTEQETGEQALMRAPKAGAHYVTDAVLAIAVARRRRIEWPRISMALRQFKALPMRWEERFVSGIRVVNDAYNASPMSMRAAIRAFHEQPGGGARWLILGGMLELGRAEEEEHLELGAFAAGYDWAGLITVGELGDLIAAGAENAGLDVRRIFRCTDAGEVPAVAGERFQNGDSVLLKASRGIGLERIIEALRRDRGLTGERDGIQDGQV
jgi:UDP-N-acetylmuramoyl-tripeptide--D-alanyl-D-alanine ligase